MGLCRWPSHFAIGKLSADGVLAFADGFEPSAKTLDPVVDRAGVQRHDERQDDSLRL